MITEVKIAELTERVKRLVDNQLSKEDEKALLQEIKDNPTVMDILKREQSFKEYLKSKLNRKKVSPNLIQSIKDKIRIVPG